MSKHSIDYQRLDQKINKRSYRLSDVQDRIEKVAFDVVRFKDDDVGANLWKIETSDDGDYIVSMYEEKAEDNVKIASLQSNWEVVSANTNLQFFYKGDPVAKVACQQFGVSAQQAKLLAKQLPHKLASDKKMVNLLLGQVGDVAKEEIINKYPELA